MKSWKCVKRKYIFSLFYTISRFIPTAKLSISVLPNTVLCVATFLILITIWRNSWCYNLQVKWTRISEGFQGTRVPGWEPLLLCPITNRCIQTSTSICISDWRWEIMNAGNPRYKKSFYLLFNLTEYMFFFATCKSVAFS